MGAKVVGLSLVQPVPWAILVAGQRVVALASPPPRGGVDTILIHAAASAGHDAYDAAVRELVARGARPPWHADAPRGGFVARAKAEFVPGANGPALQLHDVESLPCLVPAPAPAPGLLFQVDEATLERAIASARSATSVQAFRAVEAMWSAKPSRGPRSARIGTEART